LFQFSTAMERWMESGIWEELGMQGAGDRGGKKRGREEEMEGKE
jgi:hypothetical protein